MPFDPGAKRRYFSVLPGESPEHPAPETLRIGRRILLPAVSGSPAEPAGAQTKARFAGTEEDKEVYERQQEKMRS
jgi:hypothetical protein